MAQGAVFRGTQAPSRGPLGQWEQRQRQGCGEQGALTPALPQGTLRPPGCGVCVLSGVSGCNALQKALPSTAFGKAALWLPFDPLSQPRQEKSGTVGPTVWVSNTCELLRNLESHLHPKPPELELLEAAGVQQSVQSAFWAIVEQAKVCKALF